MPYRRWLAPVAMMLLGLMGGVAVYAQSSSPVPPAAGLTGTPLPVVPPISVSGQPVLGIISHTAAPPYGSGGYPFNFHFDDQLVGSFFKPGERVTITAHNVVASPVNVIADDTGNIAARISFIWRFCGPGAVREPAPSFTAAGNAGSTAGVTENAPPCPALFTLTPRPFAQPVGKPIAATAVVGGAVSVGTAIAIPPSGSPPTPAPFPTPAPVSRTFVTQGFGFRAGEHVTLQVVDPAGHFDESASRTETTADGQGRIMATLHAIVPAACTGLAFPLIVATGNEGTSVSAHLFWLRPMILCPLRGAPVSGTGSTASSGAILGVSLRSPSVHRGRLERATIVSDAAGTVSLTIKYRGNVTMHRTVRVSAGSPAIVRWRIPLHAKLGRAWIEVASPGMSLRSMFTVR
ncbi:MAG: hypothetical protein M3Z66_12510 [Chloroflexota bacterium]|nr:hypothetical protein [Chloroflexota bacterium]